MPFCNSVICSGDMLPLADGKNSLSIGFIWEIDVCYLNDASTILGCTFSINLNLIYTEWINIFAVSCISLHKADKTLCFIGISRVHLKQSNATKRYQDGANKRDRLAEAVETKRRAVEGQRWEDSDNGKGNPWQ